MNLKKLLIEAGIISVEGYLLKPQNLDIPNKPLSKNELVKFAKKGISNNKALSTLQKNYLLQLLSNNVKLTASELKKIASDQNFVGQVEKNFGEILGAIYMLSKNSNSKIEYPAAGNFPLVDFFMKSPTKTVSVSSKAGSSTGNTIKVQHVLTNADKLKVKIKPELRNILNVIATSSVTDMPLDAADVINTPELKKLKLVYKKDPSGLNLYKLESAVIKYVNDKFGSEMQDIVLKSIGDMVYVKTKINHSLGADFAVKHPSEGLNFKLRSKNSQNRWKDRVGFNVK